MKRARQARTTRLETRVSAQIVLLILIQWARVVNLAGEKCTANTIGKAEPLPETLVCFVLEILPRQIPR